MRGGSGEGPPHRVPYRLVPEPAGFRGAEQERLKGDRKPRPGL